jgi:hypothetical protein
VDDNLFGKMAAAESRPRPWEHPFINDAAWGATILGWKTQTAGHAAVWANENTRRSVFDAVHRRESHATTGPRAATSIRLARG